MSRLIAEFEQPRNAWKFKTPACDNSFPESFFGEIPSHPGRNTELTGEWTTECPAGLAGELRDVLDQLLSSEEPRPGLMDCCEQISEQLLQIRDELQFEIGADESAVLRLFPGENRSLESSV